MEELKYKVSFIPAVEVSKSSIDLKFHTKEEAENNLNSMAMLLLFLQDQGLMEDYSNVAWIEELVAGVWEELEEED